MDFRPSDCTFRALDTADRAAVEAVCSASFSSGDYLPSVFDRWIAAPGAYFYGAYDRAGHLVGIARCRLIDRDATAWCEGLRVAPALRGRGIGHALIAHGEVWAVRAGARRLRASVGSANTVSMRLFASHGFEEAARFDRWFAGPGVGGRLPRPLPLAELDLAMAFIQRYAPLTETRGTYACGWSIYDLDAERLAQHLERNEVLLAGDSIGALAIVQNFEMGTTGRPVIALLCGAPVALTRLLRGIRTLARLRTLPEVQATVAVHAGTASLLAHSGFEQQTSGYIVLQQKDLG